MNNFNTPVVQVGVSTVVSGTIATAVNLQPLWTALITLAVSLITVVGTEVVKYLSAYFKKKREELNVKEDEKGEDEQCH